MSELQYDMKIDCLSRWPLGIAQLPDGSLVVSDYSEGLVCNFTVDRNPTIWICSDLDQPTGITIDTAETTSWSHLVPRRRYICSNFQEKSFTRFPSQNVNTFKISVLERMNWL